MRFDCLAIPENNFCDEQIVCVFNGVPPRINTIIDRYNILRSKYEQEICYNNGYEYCHDKTNDKLQEKMLQCRGEVTRFTDIWHKHRR